MNLRDKLDFWRYRNFRIRGFDKVNPAKIEAIAITLADKGIGWLDLTSEERDAYRAAAFKSLVEANDYWRSNIRTD